MSAKTEQYAKGSNDGQKNWRQDLKECENW